jgi:O-antigen/teichoic acid export membrane protein
MSEAVTSSLKTAAKGAAMVFVGMIASQALWLITKLLIVGNLSKEDLGIYSLVIAIVSIIAPLASLGLWEGSTRYISIFSGQGRKEDADSVHRSSLLIGAIAGTATCVSLFLLSGILSKYVFYKPELSLPLMVVSFFIPSYVMTFILASILRGYGIISPKIYFIDIGQPLFFLIPLGFIFIAGLPFISIIYAYAASMVVVYALTAWYGYRKTGIGPFAFFGVGGHIGELLRFSIPVLSIDIMFLIFRWVDTLMLGRYGSAGVVGVYSVSVTLAAFLSLPLLALDIVYMPIAGELYARNRSPELARTYQVLTKWIFSVTLPIFFILFFFPEMTITFLFGERFGDAASPLRILSLGYLFTVFMGTNGMLLLVMGLSSAVMKISAAGTLLNILLNYILIKHIGIGMQGAAISFMVSSIVISSGCAIVLYLRSGIHPIAYVYLRPVLGSAVIGGIIYAVAKSLPLYFWMLPIYLFLYIFGYLASLILTRSIDDEDFFLFGEILKKAGVAPETARTVMGMIYKVKIKDFDLR